MYFWKSGLLGHFEIKKSNTIFWSAYQWEINNWFKLHYDECVRTIIRVLFSAFLDVIFRSTLQEISSMWSLLQEKWVMCIVPYLRDMALTYFLFDQTLQRTEYHLSLYNWFWIWLELRSFWKTYIIEYDIFGIKFKKSSYSNWKIRSLWKN